MVVNILSLPGNGYEEVTQARVKEQERLTH